MPAPHGSLLDSPLLEPALLRAAARRAQALPDSARAAMKPWASAARARYCVALELRDRETRSVALGLLREASFLALSALEVGEAHDVPSTPLVAWERFSDRAPLSAAPARLALAREALAAADLLALDRLAEADDGELRSACEETVAWLLALAEVRSPRELERARWVRSGLSLIGLIAIAWALVAYWSALSALSTPTP